MKKTIKLLLVLFPVMAIGQTQTENYIKNVIYKVPSLVAIPAPTTAQATQKTTYFDGLGRPIQQISGQQSASGNDIITHIKYDGFGRQVEEYLPFKSSNTNMAFDPAAETNVLSYYGSPNPAINGNPAQEATTNPFSRKELEASPLNRILKQAAPGDDWKSGSGHEIKMDYQANIDNDEVRLYNANTSWNSTFGLYDITLSRGSGTGFYPPGQLYKTITYDENTAAAPTETNGSTVEFKNKEGQVVLKRTYGTVGTGIANEKYDTYYVYDIYGNLTYVIPPKAVDLIDSPTAIQVNVTSTTVVTSGSYSQITATNSITLLPGFNAQSGSTFSAVIGTGNQTVLDNLCYQYKYDSHNRLVEKKLPGIQWEFIVYDKLDRLIAIGPANSPFSNITSVGWLITKYDIFNRPVYTGWTTSTAATAVGRVALQLAQNNPALTVMNETKQTNGTIDGIEAYYSNVVAPTTFKLLSVNYYDNYTFPSSPVIPTPVSVEAQNILTSTQVKGMTTASWKRILTTNISVAGETSATFYDGKARVVRTYVQNYLGGYTCIDNSLDAFSGKLKYTITKHKRLFSDATEIVTKDAFTYTDQDRLLTQTHQINGAQTPEVMLSNTYDELGQLISKKVGNNIQNINYTYNIRGWLKGINNVDVLTQGNDFKDLFAFRINYNVPTSGITDVKPLYNGNISETYWATNSDSGIIRSYGYRYDNLNRLKDAVFKNSTTLANTYNEALTYDKNGNIVTLKRNGLNGSGFLLIDDLIYSYANGNDVNKLSKVVDNAVNINGFTDSAANTVDDYSYDASGNMIKDNNKNIISITYNHLNLPTQITFASGENIVYIYNSAGQKVQRIVNKTGVSATITDYLDGFYYQNNILKFFPTAEGYVEPSGSSYKYVYQYKDHLGNIRLSYDKNLVIQEESNYYPFGLRQEGYNSIKNSSNDALKYKYQGQERQDELGLNWDSFKWRNYDTTIARFINVDPLSEKYAYQSHYNFSENRVMDGIELEGLEVVLLKDSAHNQPVKLAANSGQYKDNPYTKTIHVFAHGNPSEFYNDFGKEGETTINSGKILNNTLNSTSTLWKNSKNKEGFTIVIHACRTGRYTLDKDGNFVDPVAAKISASKEMMGVAIVAPDERDGFSAKGNEIGPQRTKYVDFNADYLFKSSPQGQQTRQFGNWNTFMYGHLIYQTSGNNVPKNRVVIGKLSEGTIVE